jgi:LysM repeat protein
LPVRCAFDGKVRLARKFSGYGNMVLVRHKNGLETVYGHLKSMSVNVNDTIKAGAVIGLGGRTGRATTDHLHFETRIFGDPFDSNKYIDFETFSLRSDYIYYRNKSISIDLDDLKDPKKPAPKVKPTPNANANTLAKVDPNATQHVIRQGDNLWSISKLYKTTVQNLCSLNNITTRTVLKIGSTLVVQ